MVSLSRLAQLTLNTSRLLRCKSTQVAATSEFKRYSGKMNFVAVLSRATILSLSTRDDEMASLIRECPQVN